MNSLRLHVIDPDLHVLIYNNDVSFCSTFRERYKFDNHNSSQVNFYDHINFQSVALWILLKMNKSRSLVTVNIAVFPHLKVIQAMD